MSQPRTRKTASLVRRACSRETSRPEKWRPISSSSRSSSDFRSGFAISPLAFRDGDVSWQIAAGRWIIAHGHIPTTDPFSFTVAGHPWVAMEWLSEIVYATAYRLAGWGGEAATVAAALIALNALVFFYLQRRVSVVVASASLLMLEIVLAPFVLARPHLLAWPLLAGWTIVLLRAAEKGRPPSLWWTLLLVVWTNAHASFPLALPIAGAIGLDSVIEARWTNFRQWLVFGIVSALALMLNANGLAGLLQPFRTASLTMLPLIGEWHPSSTAQHARILRRPAAWHRWNAVDGHSRADRPAPAPAGPARPRLPARAPPGDLHHRRRPRRPALARIRPSAAKVPKWLLLGCVPMLAYALLAPMKPPEGRANPRSLIAAVPAGLRSQPVFNEYSFGGPLILAGIKPYIDGRAEIYGDDFVENYRTSSMATCPRSTAR